MRRRPQGSGMPVTKKKVKLGALDVDLEQFALVAHYSTEIRHFDERTEQEIGSESVPGSKVVRLPRGLAGADLAGIAQDVVERCKYISSSKVGEVERILAGLAEREALEEQQQRVQPQPQPPPSHRAGGHGGHGRGDSTSRSGAGRRERGDPRGGDELEQSLSEPRSEPRPSSRPSSAMSGTGRSAKAASPPVRQDPLLPHAEARYIDEYADQLYEENMNVKVRGAKCILRVCSEAQNLEYLAEHETLLGVLSRELRESSKKSAELSIAIVCTFLCFSHFSQFHPLLMQHQCGDVTMRVVEYESTRHQIRKEEMEKRISQLVDATAEERKQLAKDEKKYRNQLNRQNKLLLVCQMMLLNLAEELVIEKKLINRKMPILLGQMLDRTHEDVLLVSLQFLKKLSVFEENKDSISLPSTLALCVNHAAHSNVRVALLALRLLYNFSFDEEVRSSLVESGIVKLLVDHLRNPPFRHIVLRLLYQFSMDDRCRSTMALYHEGMVMLLQLVVHFPEPRVGKDLVALVANLATNALAADVIVQSGLFPQVLLRVMKTRDPLLCKVVRHVSLHPEVLEPMYELLQSEGARMSRWMGEFVNIANRCLENPDFLVEVLGVLANLTLPQVPWGELCECGLIELLHRTLAGGNLTEDDIVLECVLIVGNLALCKEACHHVTASRLPKMLQDLLVEKRDDEEIILQLLYAFECLLVHDEVRDLILQETEVAPCVMRFARARNPKILEQAGKTLQVISEYCVELSANSDGASQLAWVEQIKVFRFEQHNSEWSRFVERETSGGGAQTQGFKGGHFYDGGSEDERSGSEDEEEFGFHWVDAADAQDLANRDWGNQDMGDFMHTSRQMAY